MRRDTCICVFLKPPLAGKVKTRLIPVVGAEGAAALAEAFLRDAWNCAESLSWAVPVVATTDSLSPGILPQADTEVWLQGGGDLGARIERILRRALTRAPFAMAFGADSPGIPPSLLDRAREALRSADAVIGPCDDGGFYLLGVRACPPGLLAGIPWSQSTTFARTLDRLNKRGLSTTVLDQWYDVDRPDDLERLSSDLAIRAIMAPNTAKALADLRASGAAPSGRVSQHQSARFEGRWTSGPMRISVVIPVLNEKEDLPCTLRALAELSDLHEIIVVDGGSTDGTRESISACLPARARLMDGPHGRGNQLNAGARAATGDIVLFLHADTRLPAGALQQIAEAVSKPAMVGGGFCVRFLENKPWILRVVAAGINFRTRLFRAPTGDQGIFSRCDAFSAVGGFAEWPIFEDVDFVQRLKRQGRFVIIPSPVTTSARRYIACGVFRTVFLMYALRVGYWLWVSPFRLHRWFRDVRPHLLRDRKCELSK